MFPLLHQYLLEHSSLHFPGIGTLAFEETPARLDIADQQLYAPKRTLHLHKEEVATKDSLNAFLASQLDITPAQSWEVFNQFSSTISGSLSTKKQVEWENLGTFHKDADGSIRFIQTPILETYLPPVPAERVIRQNVEHLITVGDTETTNTAMQEYYEDDETPRKRDFWWIWALLILAVSGVLIWLKYFNK